LNVEKIADWGIAQHPLYALDIDPLTNTLYAGGLDSALLKVPLGLQEIKQGGFEKLGQYIERILGLKNPVYTLFYDPQQNAIWAGGSKGWVQKFDLKTSTFSTTYNLGPYPIFSFQSDLLHNALLVSQGNGLIHSLTEENLNNNTLEGGEFKEKEISTYKISDDAIRVMKYSNDGKELATAGKDGKIRVLDSESLQEKHRIEAHAFPIFALAYSPDGTYLLSGSRDASIKIWRTEDYKLIQTIPAHLFAINQILFHPTLPYFLSASMDKSIKIWGSDDFKLYKILNAEKTGGHTTSVNRMVFTNAPSPSLISIGDDRRMLIWHLDFET